MTRRILLMGGSVHSRTDPFATALLIDDGRIAWVGDDAGADVHRDVVDEVINLQGAFVAPGFVDSHVHATSTGLQLTGLDLAEITSAEELLDAVHQSATANRGGLVYGHGWDETRWVDPQLPNRAELDRAAWGSEVYLSRIDVHSALVSSPLVARVTGVRGLDGFDDSGAIARQAHAAVRAAAFDRLTGKERTAAQQATCDHALRNGIVAIHEMSGPSIAGFNDAANLRAIAQTRPGPHVTILWGELASPEAFERMDQLDAYGLGGDLFVDGSIGSHTAALLEPYTDAPSTSGAMYIDEEQIREHVRACTKAGVPAGFHVIGDAACSQVASAIRAVAQEVGSDQVRQRGHRLEHVEMISGSDIESLASLGVVFSMQPLFDALWGSDDGMYEQRLGDERRRDMNRWADVVAAGGHLTINSDSPVTPMNPWSIIRAATEHSNLDQRITARAAFTAHTRGGWRAIREMDAGVIAPGAPASLAIWDVAELEVRVPDARVQGWSTDPRAATPGLPVLDGPDPRCLATLVDGQVAYGDDYWRGSRAQ